MLVAALLTGPASADGPSRWTGFYAGLHAGYGWGKHEGTGVYSWTDNNGDHALNVLDPETGHINLQGATGGGQLGFNIQSGALVYGLEVDGSWSGLSGDKTFISDDGNDGSTDYTWRIKTDVDWLASVRGRIGGLLTPTFLVYGTGGVAFAGVNSDETVVGFPPQALNHETTVLASSNQNVVGWTAGVGAEWLISPNWTVQAAWHYYRFDDVDSHFKGTAYPTKAPCAGAPSPNCSFAYDQDSFPGSLEINTFRVGINYKFGGN
jgi:outer membrane immunogenic protein